MIRTAWYAVCWSHEVSTSPAKFTIHSEDFIAVRDSFGIVHAFQAHCPHRGCDLSKASFNNDEIVCPFHGWRFDITGTCTHIPANQNAARIPSKARLSSYPSCEKSGLVWVYTVCTGSIAIEEHPALALFDELDTDWRIVPFCSTWNAHFTRVVESVLDVSHLPFVHPETSGQDISPIVEGLKYCVSKTGILIYPNQFGPSHPMEPLPSPPDCEKQTEIELVFPNQWMIRTPLGDTTRMCTFLTFTPVTLDVTNIFGFVIRNFDCESDVFDELHLNHTHFVMNQDKAIVESLRPVQPPDLKYELHVPSDTPTIRFRTMMFNAMKRETELKNGALPFL